MSGATLPAQLLDRARQTPGRTAFRHKRLGIWEVTTWAAYAADAAAIGLALEALGVRPGDRVAVAADNRPEWLLADLGVQGIGGVTVGISPTSSEHEVHHLLSRTSARVVVCDNEEQLDKVLGSRAELPDLMAAVVVDTRGVRDLGGDPLVSTWADLLMQGRALDGASWRAKVEALDPSATTVIVYTSGTTGRAEGSELSSQQLVAAGAAFRSVHPVTPDDEALSYLPLWHIAERLTSVIDALAIGYVVNFGEGGSSFPQDLREVQPTVFLGLPPFWEKTMAETETRMADASLVKRSVYRWCTNVGAAPAVRRKADTPKAVDPGLRALCSLLCFRQLRRKLGLGRVTTAICGPAQIAPEVLQWFGAIGIDVRDGDGQIGTITSFTPLIASLYSSPVRDAVPA